MCNIVNVYIIDAHTGCYILSEFQLHFVIHILCIVCVCASMYAGACVNRCPL